LVSAVVVHLLQKWKGLKTEEQGLLGCATVHLDRAHHFRGVCCPYLVSYSTYSSTLEVKAVCKYRKLDSLHTTRRYNPEKHTLNHYCVRISNLVESKLIMDTNEFIQNKPEYLHHPGKWNRCNTKLKTVVSDHEPQLSSFIPKSEVSFPLL
jgi:hypothetical protein